MTFLQRKEKQDDTDYLIILGAKKVRLHLLCVRVCVRASALLEGVVKGTIRTNPYGKRNLNNGNNCSGQSSVQKLVLFVFQESFMRFFSPSYSGSGEQHSFSGICKENSHAKE